MKAFTDIEQSEKLAEILPIESADMWWAERYEGHTTMDFQYVIEETPYYYLSLKKPSIDNYSQDAINDIPCWSLSALLGVIPSGKALIHDKGNLGYKCICNNMDTYFHDNPVDACYEMILKLHELKML